MIEAVPTTRNILLRLQSDLGEKASTQQKFADYLGISQSYLSRLLDDRGRRREMGGTLAMRILAKHPYLWNDIEALFVSRNMRISIG